MSEQHQPADGIAEIGQKEIEKRATEGDGKMNPQDIERAREEVLGKSSPELAHPPTKKDNPS